MPLWPIQKREDNYWDIYITNVELWYEKTLVPPLLTSGVWSLANRIVYTPVVIPRSPRYPVEQFNSWVPTLWHGAAVSGFYMIGVYNDDEGKPGELLLRSEIGLHSVVSTWGTPVVPNGVVLGRGLHWLAAVFDNTTAQVTRLATLAVNGPGQLASIFYEDRAVLELPDTATPVLATIALGSVPVMAILGG